MNPPRNLNKKFGAAAALLCVGLISAQLFWSSSTSTIAQNTQTDPGLNPKTTPPPAGTNTPAGTGTNTPTAATATGSTTNQSSAAVSTNSPAPASGDKGTNEDIQVSFQGANIDMIVQWLAQTTGKSVVKHPQVQCQLTIVSSKKVSPRDAVTLVYRALSLEGFTAVESADSILIVPEGKEPKMSPEFLDASRTDSPVGRQRLVKIFPLKFIQAGDLKEKVKGLLSEKATIDVDERANQVIVTDYTENMSLVADFVKALDTDKPGDISVRVIPLKNVSAQDLVKDLTPLYQKLSGKGGKEQIEVSANDRANSLMVLSSQANFAAIQKVVETLDTEDAQEKVMHAFQLKNADAEDVAKQLKELAQDQDNGSRNRFFYYGYNPGSSSGKKMSVVADRRRNTVVVQAPPAAMEGIEKMVAALDEPVNDDSLAPKIYPLKYVSAVDIEDVLNELFLKKTQQRPYFYYFDESEDSSTPDRDVGRLYGKVRITSEPYSNAIILTSNSAENLAAVVEVLKQLDVPSQAGESTFRVGLRFAKAATVANSLNVLFAKIGSPPLQTPPQAGQQNNQQQQPQQQQGGQPASSALSNFDLEQESKEQGYFPWLGGTPENTRSSDGRNTSRPVSDLVGRVRVVPDQRSNALLISANVHFFPQVIKLIEDLDAPTPQVVIEARIVEVSSDFLDQLGVRWSPNGSTFTQNDFDNSVMVSSGAQYNKGFGGNTSINNPPPSSSVASAITSLRSGVLSSSVSMDFLIQFLHENTHATVLASPQINIEDNELGKLFVGQQVPFITQSQNTDVGALNQSFAYKPVGVVLEVTPHINTSGDVSLKIHAESSSIVPGQTLFGGAIINTRTFRTDLEAKSGQTLVLGGIVQKQVTDTLRKTPILGSIPGLGWAFKKKDKTVNDVELLVFLRPRVVRTPVEAKELLDEVNRQNPLVRQSEEDMRSGKDKKNEPFDR